MTYIWKQTNMFTLTITIIIICFQDITFYKDLNEVDNNVFMNYYKKLITHKKRKLLKKNFLIMVKILLNIFLQLQFF